MARVGVLPQPILEDAKVVKQLGVGWGVRERLLGGSESDRVLVLQVRANVGEQLGDTVV